MSRSDASVVEMEEFISPGSGHDHNDSVDSSRPNSFGILRRAVRKCCRDNYYRRLSIASIICGLSCIGICALKYSVMAEEKQRRNPEEAAKFEKKAKKYGIISIVVFFSILAVSPALLALISYLATFKD